MYHAAIVEDESAVLSYLRHCLSDAFTSHGESVEFDAFEGAEGFLSMLSEHYHFDMAFLDIEMPGMDGISLCRKIREIAPDILVVFISNKDELVFQTFEVQPFRFIRKSEFAHFVEPLCSAVLEELRRRQPEIIRVVEPLSQDVYSFNVRKILYVEAQGKTCLVHTDDHETTGIRIKFSDLAKMLSGHCFIQTHRSYLVNSAFIFHVGRNSVVLTDHEEIPISRGKTDAVRQQFLEYCTR
ncbi:MAG: LytTR family DNA-binding domain-containing protein [Lachnospiraceae bacterium]|jgi:DNA-binding LytR/AlgR family response regulator